MTLTAPLSTTGRAHLHRTGPMLQSYTATTRPDQGPPRLKALREELARRGLTGFLVPRVGFSRPARSDPISVLVTPGEFAIWG